MYGGKGEIVGPATGKNTKGKGVSVLFPGNKGRVECLLTKLSRAAPPTTDATADDDAGLAAAMMASSITDANPDATPDTDATANATTDAPAQCPKPWFPVLLLAPFLAAPVL